MQHHAQSGANTLPEIKMTIIYKKLFAFGIAALLLAGLQGEARAQEGLYYGCGRCAGQPALTPEQQANARKIFNENYENTRNIREALGEKRAELDALLSAANPDKARIEDLSREIGELRGKMIAARVEVRNKLAQAGLPADLYGTDGFEGNGGWSHGKRRHHHRHW